MNKVFLTIDNLTNRGYDRLVKAKIISKKLIKISFIDVDKKRRTAIRSYVVLGKIGRYKKIVLGELVNE